MKMKLTRLAAILALGILVAACGQVSPGEVGVMYHTIGGSGDRGVEQTPKGVGYYFLGFGSHLVTFPTFTQNQNWTEKNGEQFAFSDRNGLNITADIGISYHVDPDKAPALFVKYRRGIHEITDTYIHNMVRDALIDRASRMQIEDIYGPKRQQLITDVQSDVIKEVQGLGLVVEKIYWIGNLGLPPSIVESINLKNVAVQQSQQRENQVATAKAQADIEVAKATGEANAKKIQADGEAYANRTIAASITEPLIELKKIDKWNGENSQVVTAGGGAVLMNMSK